MQTKPKLDVCITIFHHEAMKDLKQIEKIKAEKLGASTAPIQYYKKEDVVETIGLKSVCEYANELNEAITLLINEAGIDSPIRSGSGPEYAFKWYPISYRKHDHQSDMEIEILRQVLCFSSLVKEIDFWCPRLFGINVKVSLEVDGTHRYALRYDHKKDQTEYPPEKDTVAELLWFYQEALVTDIFEIANTFQFKKSLDNALKLNPEKQRGIIKI